MNIISTIIDLNIDSFPKDKSYWEAVAASEEIAMPYPVTIVLAETVGLFTDDVQSFMNLLEQ